MTVGQWILVGLVALGVLYWLLNALLVLRTIRRVPVLERLRPREPQRWPKLSVIIPACNEADIIEAATRSRLSDGYPNLEVLLIDDRSDDATGEIIDRLAATDDRVRALHITELPDGWLGKVHALQRGVEATTGEWLLFTDADVHVEPGTLRRTVAYCVERELDFLAAIPQFWPATFLLGCVLASFIRIICLSLRLWAVEDPKSTASVGVGAFNLVRRAALERTAGFEEIRMTVGDDVALGQMLKRCGRKCAAVNARRYVGLYFYRSLAEAARATEKSVLVAFQFSYLRLVATSLVMLWCELSPIVALLAFAGGLSGSPDTEFATSPDAGLAGQALSAVGGLGDEAFAPPISGHAGPALGMLGVEGLALAGLGVTGMLLALFSTLAINRWARMPLLPAAFFPLGVLLNTVIVARAAVLAAWRGGHMWRGVLYPNDVLRAGNRLRFP